MLEAPTGLVYELMVPIAAAGTHQSDELIAGARTVLSGAEGGNGLGLGVVVVGWGVTADSLSQGLRPGVVEWLTRSISSGCLISPRCNPVHAMCSLLPRPPGAL